MATSTNKTNTSGKDDDTGGEWITPNSPKSRPGSKTPAKSVNNKPSTKEVTPAAGQGTSCANRHHSLRNGFDSKGKEETKEETEEKTKKDMEEADDGKKTCLSAAGQMGRPKSEVERTTRRGRTCCMLQGEEGAVGRRVVGHALGDLVDSSEADSTTSGTARKKKKNKNKNKNKKNKKNKKSKGKGKGRKQGQEGSKSDQSKEEGRTQAQLR